MTRGLCATVTLLMLGLPLPVWAQQVVAVPTAKTLQLDDGQTVRLAALQAPNPGQPLAEEALESLEALAKGRSVSLTPVGSGIDRRGRVVAMAYSGDIWLQAEMLRQGMGWVYSFSDSRDFASGLLAVEREAEAAGRGVWSQPAYAVLSVDEAPQHLGEFRLVRGSVVDVAEVRGTYYLNFGADWKTDFTLQIAKSDARAFDAGWLQALEGKAIRARGWLFEKNGPAIELTHPEQVEILP
jgi:micrococcal nuclease